MKVGFLDRFAMNTLRVGQTEQAFFEEWAETILVSIAFCNNTSTQDSLFLVPECKSNVHSAVGVRDSRDTVLTPAEGAAASHVVGEVGPGIAVGAVGSGQQRVSRGMNWIAG